MTVLRTIFAALVVGAAVSAPGCAAGDPQPQSQRLLDPVDFARAPQPAGSSMHREPTAVGLGTGSDSTPTPSVTPLPVKGSVAGRALDDAASTAHRAEGVLANTTPKGVATPSVSPSPVPVGSRFTVDAMVGQVNGQPLYAGTVLEPIIEQLKALGRALPRQEFLERARQLIEARVGQMVADALIVGEAESDLSQQEHAGLANILKQQREELIRFWGKGSVAVAEETLVRQTSRSLDQTLTETRQRMLVQRYLRQKLFPKINVTRKDVQRYYEDHLDEYNPAPRRTLRVIYVEDPAHAQQVDGMLAQGRPFAEVASLPLNRYRREDGGLMSEQAEGDQVFGQEELNHAMLRLQIGEHSPRVQADGRYWWVALDAVETAASRSLNEVQLEIEALLRRQRFQALTEQYRRTLFTKGSYNSIETMSRAIVEVAASRFASAN